MQGVERQQIQTRHKKHIDRFVSALHNVFMARFSDVVDGLGKQAIADADDICKTGEEMEELRPAYQRYRDLAEHLDGRTERIRIALALLAKQEKWHLGEAFGILDKAGVELEDPAEIRESMSLWKMIREVVRQTEELRIVELENIMNALKVKTSRQAIEAAIDAHKRTFHVRRSGREKFVSLKH